MSSNGRNDRYPYRGDIIIENILRPFEKYYDYRFKTCRNIIKLLNIIFDSMRGISLSLIKFLAKDIVCEKSTHCRAIWSRT